MRAIVVTELRPTLVHYTLELACRAQEDLEARRTAGKLLVVLGR